MTSDIPDSTLRGGDPTLRGGRWPLLLVALLGGVLLVDGALRGEMRHRAIGVALGASLCFPWFTSLAFGARVRRFWTRVLVSVATLLLLFVGLEVTVRVLDLRFFTVPEVIYDPVLGHALEPGRGTIDAWGFRNREVPERTDVVCLGDSQTYGTNIRRGDTWPAALGEVSGLATYNMGLNGYGPVQYRALTERALTLEPAAVVIGFYFGNDLLDAHLFAGLDAWAELRDPTVGYRVPDSVDFGDPRSLNWSMALVDGVMARSRVVATAGHHAKLWLKSRRAASDLYWEEEHPESYGRGRIRTSFAADDLLQSVTTDNVWIDDGVRIAERCLAEVGAQCAAHEVTPVVLLIHTKEFYYHALLAERGEAEAAALAELARAETEVTERLRAAAERAGLLVVDPSPDVHRALAADLPLYPPDYDIHLNREGCRLFAEVLARELQKVPEIAARRR